MFKSPPLTSSHPSTGIPWFGGFNCLFFYFQISFWAGNERCCQSHSAYFHICNIELNSLGLLLIYRVKRVRRMLRWWRNSKSINLGGFLFWLLLWLLLLFLEQETNSSCEIKPFTIFTQKKKKKARCQAAPESVSFTFHAFFFPFLAQLRRITVWCFSAAWRWNE